MNRKLICLFLSFIIAFACFTNVTIKAGAMNTGFSTEELSVEEQNTFVSNVEIELLTEEPEKRNILCFDVNNQGMIAIGQSGLRGKEVCIFNTSGEFLYGYTFNCNQSFGIEWDGKCINIYFVRSDVIISVDSNGDIIEAKEVQDTTDNNTHRNKLLYSTSRTVGDTTYQIRNNLGVFSWIKLFYSQVIGIGIDGEESIIYDVGSNPVLIMVILLGFIILFFGVVTIIALNFDKENRNK